MAGDTCRRRAPVGLVILHVCLVNVVVVCETLEQPCPIPPRVPLSSLVLLRARESFQILFPSKKKMKFIIIVETIKSWDQKFKILLQRIFTHKKILYIERESHFNVNIFYKRMFPWLKFLERDVFKLKYKNSLFKIQNFLFQITL